MDENSKSILLPSGRMATVRAPKVRDLLRAHRVAGFSNEPLAITMALIAEVCQIDGRVMLYEDLLDLAAEDGLALQAEVIDARDANGRYPMGPARQEAAPETNYQAREQSRDSSGSDSL